MIIIAKNVYESVNQTKSIILHIYLSVYVKIIVNKKRLKKQDDSWSWKKDFSLVLIDEQTVINSDINHQLFIGYIVLTLIISSTKRQNAFPLCKIHKRLSAAMFFFLDFHYYQLDCLPKSPPRTTSKKMTNSVYSICSVFLLRYLVGVIVGKFLRIISAHIYSYSFPATNGPSKGSNSRHLIANFLLYFIQGEMQCTCL